VHASLVENTSTIAFGTGIVATFGALVPSCIAWTLKTTFNVADALITCESAGDVLALKSPLPA